MFKNKSNTNNTFKFLFSVSGPPDNFKNDAHCRKIFSKFSGNRYNYLNHNYPTFFAC